MHSLLRLRIGAAALAACSVPILSSSALAFEDKPECRTIGKMTIMFAAGTSEENKQETLKRVAPYAFDETDYQVGGRWSVTSFGGTGAFGNPMRISYSYVPDGTFVPNQGLGSGNSSLFARMNALFGGNTALWQSKFEAVFERWDFLTGANYELAPDDGASLHASPGVQNVRGDVRICMITLADPNVLAYNFFPNIGDMVINRSPGWNNSTNDYRFLRNTVSHEHGHGMGLNHVIPTNSTKLMEPFLNVNFDGPQSDDIQGGQFLYGDWLENNDQNATRSDLGIATNGQLIDILAIERNTDVDWFRIEIPPGNNLGVTITPVGSTYQQGPQGGSPTVRDSLRIHDLRLSAYQSDGTTLIQTVNAGGMGVAETITGIARPPSGDISIKVDSVTASGDIQRYRMNLALTPANVVVAPSFLDIIRGTVVSGNLASLVNSDDNRLVMEPGIVLVSNQAPIEIVVEGDSAELDPTLLRMSIEAVASAGSIQRTVELFNFDTSLYEEVASGAVGTSENTVNIDIASNPGRFVAADGTIRARLKNRANGPVLIWPWTGSIDKIAWELTP
jgi:hypothetical protein